MGEYLRDRIAAEIEHDDELHGCVLEDSTREVLRECAAELRRLASVEAAALRSEERWLHDATMRADAERRLAVARDALARIATYEQRYAHHDARVALAAIDAPEAK